MPRQNYLILICLILLGATILVRTAAIAQRAYDMLSPPMSGDERASATNAVTAGRMAEPSVTLSVQPIVASVISTPSVEESPPNVAVENVSDVGRSATGHVSQRLAPGMPHKKITRARPHYAARYSYRSDRKFWPMWW
jgi:hypothetical protein